MLITIHIIFLTREIYAVCTYMGRGAYIHNYFLNYRNIHCLTCKNLKHDNYMVMQEQTYCLHAYYVPTEHLISLSLSEHLLSLSLLIYIYINTHNTCTLAICSPTETIKNKIMCVTITASKQQVPTVPLAAYTLRHQFHIFTAICPQKARFDLIYCTDISNKARFTRIRPLANRRQC